ncbi:MAG: glycosyltransferase family 4 protein [Kofleriaceae bacterium]|nr:glycosyltransferase family 4 protein [Kofleriaceae bacterium]
MKIGVVTTSYPRHDGDAAGNFVAAHVGAMRALGHEVTVIAAAHELPGTLLAGAGGPDELERRGLRGLVEAAQTTARLTALVTRRARDCDLLVAHWLAPSAIAALPSRVPVLAIAHGGDVHTLRRLHLLGPVLRLLRARGVRIAFVSPELRDIAVAAAPVPDAIVQPMGLDVAHFAALGRAPKQEILVAARLVPIKGVDVAIAALAHVPTARLVIAGDGPERASLEGLARRLRLADRVTFAGTVDARRRDQLLREAAVVVVPSRVLANGRTEGTPMIALEALATGVPVVASAVGGLASLHGAVRVRPDDPRALSTAVDRILTLPPPAQELRSSVRHLAWTHVAAHLLAHAGCATGDTRSSPSA